MTPENQDHQPDETVILGQSTQPFQGQAQQAANKKYEIIRPLGKGGFAWVYLVKNLDLDRMEAIKILSSELNDEEVLDRFVKEARISANFNHQNIITIFEVQRSGYWAPFIVPEKLKQRHQEPFTYFTMSFVEGFTASAMLKKHGQIPLRKVLKIAIGATNALDYAHSKAVTHRDIKPENILVNRQGEAILMDFGIAKAANQTRKTAAGTFMGTARYVSPEQAMGHEVDGRADLYSLGITLYELIAGRSPFDSDEWMTVLYQHIHEAPPSPSEFVPDLDRDFQNVLLKLLEKDPKARYQSAKELLPALMMIYTRLGGEEYGTEALEQIATRADILKQPTPSDLHSNIPVRRAAKQEKLRPQEKQAEETPKPKRNWTLPAFLAAAVIIIAAVLIPWLLPKAEVPPEDPNVSQTTENPNETVVAPGQLFVSVFPSGELTQITDSSGQLIDLAARTLPQTLSLPPGSYELAVSYKDESRLKRVLVKEGETVRNHFYFEIDESAYLLEDLK